MRILGVDFGLRKTGFAIADGSLSEPYIVFRYRDLGVLKKKVKDIVQKEMEKNLDIPIVFQDETLSTKRAQLKSIEAGVRRKKRKEMEDAYAAALILQDYLDNY